MKLLDEIEKSFDENFGFYEIYVCCDCGHTKEDHYWNSGGRLEASGYGRCRNGDCKCISGNWKIERVAEDNAAIKFFYRHHLTQLLEKIEREHTVNGPSSSVTPTPEYWKTHPTPEVKDWEEEFEKYMNRHKVFDSNAIELAKSFISSQISQAKEEAVEEEKRELRQKIQDMRMIINGRDKTAFEIWQEANRIVGNTLTKGE